MAAAFSHCTGAKDSNVAPDSPLYTHCLTQLLKPMYRRRILLKISVINIEVQRI
ncbi:hypothetical protein DCAR_0310193 [Daucus carota subsp. sativus]|uniref:Uncharacterized protein n=1 Tax=Daucus carota subsp. sativus TaxID=79200 RepID=A0A162AFS4_DAUCS|nr:hypothetical protein DCAR_0310193 [Daucus carota subsp. sativus]